MKHTLKDFINHYEPRTLQLLIAKHIVNVDLDVEGSWFIIRNFNKEKFYLLNYDNTTKHLILTIEKKEG